MNSTLTTLLPELDALEQRIETALQSGLTDAAQALELDAQATAAYAGMSGATRASTVAYVATAQNTNTAAALAAYQKAAEKLVGFTGHSGQALLEDADPVQVDEMKIILTVPTDYIKKLEFDRGGQKAFLADTLLSHTSAIQHAYEQRLRQVL